MRRRMIDPGIWTNDKFGLLTKEARLLFIGMITIADDEGRLKAMPHYLKAKIFPYDDITADEVKTAFQQCVDNRLIHHYKNGHDEYCFLFGWHEHQSIRSDMKRESSLPSPESLQPRNGHVTDTLQPRNVDDTKSHPNTIQYKDKTNTKQGNKEKPPKHKYGQFKNVLLSDIELKKLKERFGVDGANKRIEKISYGIESKGYKYKSHYAAILNWERMDEERNQKPTGDKLPTGDELEAQARKYQ